MSSTQSVHCRDSGSWAQPIPRRKSSRDMCGSDRQLKSNAGSADIGPGKGQFQPSAFKSHLPSPPITMHHASATSPRPSRSPSFCCSGRTSPSLGGESILASVQAMIGDVLPQATVVGFKRIPTPTPVRRLLEVRVLQASDDEESEHELTISIGPAPALQMLRSERWLFGSEASILEYLWDELEEREATTEECVVKSDEQKDDAKESGSQAGAATETKESDDSSETASDCPGDETEDEPDKGHSLLCDTSRFIPRLYCHRSAGHSANGRPFTVLSSISGMPLTAIQQSMPDNIKESISHELGTFMAQLGTIISPADRFGPAVAALNPPKPDLLRMGAQGLQYTGGACDWNTAFQSYLETVLRDGEDLQIMLPYAELRAQVQRLASLLSQVKTPRLFLVELGDDSIHCKVATTSSTAELPTPPASSTSEPPNLKFNLAGILDLSTAFFGDVLLSTAFTSSPTRDFLASFTKLPPEQLDPNDPATWTTPLIDDQQHARARIILYQAFHSTVDIVRAHVRPGTNGVKDELIARKKLSEYLERLKNTAVAGNVLKNPTKETDLPKTMKGKPQIINDGLAKDR